MDTRIYSQDTLDKYIISNVCQDDKTLYKYYTDGKTKEFRVTFIKTDRSETNVEDCS